MEKMTFEEYKAIQAKVREKLVELSKEKTERLHLCLHQKEERVKKLRDALALQKHEMMSAITDVEAMFHYELKSIEAEFNSRKVELTNERDMATVIFTRQSRGQYPEMPDVPAFADDDVADIEPNVELDKREEGDDE